MPIPDYESIMLPLLKLSADGKERTNREGIEHLAHFFSLTDIEKKELLPSGKQPRFENKFGWAKFYLVKAGLLEAPKRAIFQITKRGNEVLAEKPVKLDREYLSKFPEFQEFIKRPQNKPQENSKARETQEDLQSKTPNELMGEAYIQIRAALADELLEKVKSCSPSFFEWLVVELLVKMGYGGSIQEAGKVIGKVGDGGIDGVIKEDKLGLDLIYIQAKRWENNVGRPQVQAFAGALQGVGAKKGILVTTSDFTEETKQYVKSNTTSKIVLINGKTLSDLMIDYDIGVSKVSAYEIKRLDSDYFSDE